MTGDSTLFTELFSSDAAYRLTLSLGHTLWQGVVIGAAALLLARMMRRRSAQARHLTYMAALLAMVLCLPANLLWVAGPDPPGPSTRTSPTQADSDDTTSTADNTENRPTALLPPADLATLPPNAVGDPIQGGDTETTDLLTAPITATEDTRPADSQDAATAGNTRPAPVAAAPPSGRAQAWRTAAPWVVPIYGLGLLLAGFRLILAYRGGQQLRRLSVSPNEHAPGLLARFREQAQRIGMAAAPEFAILPADLPKRFAHVGPVVIGVLRPVVLLPAAALTQMTPAQVEAVLAHELAHIKRYDPWLMLFQRAVETVLFFHPMVWLISRLASVEREHACDDLALRAGAQPGHYAEALLHFARQNATEGNHAPRNLAAAALGMAQRTAPAKALEHRLARLFGQRIPNPLRLTRKGLLGLALVGLVGLTALVTTTRAQPPGPYFAEEEVIPDVAYPDPTADPHPPLAMQVKYVRPTHTEVLFDPDGNRLEETWMDDAGSHNRGGDDDFLREIIIELPDDCPTLTFAPTGSRIEITGRSMGLGNIRPEVCYRADGSPYILIREHINPRHLPNPSRIDLTLAYFVDDERGAAEAVFLGPFQPDRAVADATGRYRITARIIRKHNNRADDWSATVELPEALDPMDASVMDSYLIAYDRWGRAFPLENLSYRDLPNGKGEMTFDIQGHDGPGLEEVARLAFNETPRTITFRNIVVDWDGWTDREEPYPPYIDAMAAHLGWPVETQADRDTILRADLTLEEAFVVMDVAQNYATTRVWRTLRDHEPRLTFDELTAEQQAQVLATATNWIDASDPQVQRAGLEMGLWTGDLRFWDPAITYIRRKGYNASGILYDLSRKLARQMEAVHFNDIVTLVDSAERAADVDTVMTAFRITGSHTQPVKRRAATVVALVELARHDDPWVWYAAINRITENSHTLHDADNNIARETVFPRLAADSDEMLRRCAIVVPDAEALGRPLPPREALRLEEVFTPAMWRMVRIGDFFALYDHWITDDPADLDQWELVIGFLDQLDEEWSLSRGDGWSRDNGVIVHRVVQHLNAVFDQDLGGLGQVRTETASRIGNGKDYRQIARDAVAWYRGPDGPFPDRGFRRPSVVSTLRADDGDYRWNIGEGYGGYLAEGLAFIEPVGDEQHATVRGNAGGSNGTPYDGSVQLHLETKTEGGMFTVTRTVVSSDENNRRLSSVESSHAIPEGAEVQIVTSRVRSNTAMIGTGYTTLWEARFVRDGEVLQSIVYAVRALMPREVGTDSSKHFEPRLPEGRAMPQPGDPRLHFAAVAIGAAPNPEVQRADLIGTWRLDDEDATVQYTDAAGRAVRVVQTLELREDGSAVRQVVKSYEDDPATPTHYERFEGRWVLDDAEPLDGDGPGLYLRGESVPIEEAIPQVEDGWDAQLTIAQYLGSVWSVSESPDNETVMTTARWGTDIHLIDRWTRIDAEDAAELDPGSHGAVDTAEAFIAALLLARPDDAHALTHGLDERSCGRFAELALLDIGDGFGAGPVYRDLRQQNQGDGADPVGEAAEQPETLGVVFAPIVVPATLADKDEEQRMALIVELQQVDGLWRVTGIEPEEMGEDFYEQFQQAHDAGRIEKLQADPLPLPPRIVGYRDPKPLDLHRAIMAGDLERVEALLDEHPGWVHARLAIQENNTPLHTAITQACWAYDKTEDDGRRGIALFELLLDRGADINAVNEGGRTVLSFFCGWYGPVGRSQPEAGLAALRLLIERGADVNHIGRNGRTPLYSLALSSLGHRQTAHQPIADAAALLLEAGADPGLAVSTESDDRMRTPIHLALHELNPPLLAVLLEHGIDPAGPAMQALPPLHALAVARYRGNTSNAERKAVLERDTLACARLLVEHGADPWTRVLTERGYTTGAINLRGIACTAWDWAPDSPMRDYLGEQMAPRRAELEAEARAICERFVRAALAGDAEAMRADTAEVFVLHDPQPTQRMLPHVAELLRDNLDLDFDAEDMELPIVAVTGRLREGGVLLRNKEGANSPYTVVLTVHDGRRWRVIATRPWHQDGVMGAMRNLFDFRRESVGFVRYQATGELPVAFGGSRTGAVHRSEFAVLGLDEAGQMTIAWHGRGRHIATTQLTRDDTDGVIHIDHSDLGIHHNRGTLTYNSIELTHNSVLLPDGTRLVTAEGQLAVLKDGNADLVPRGGSVRIDLTDHRVEVVPPAPPGDQPAPADAGGEPEDDNGNADADAVGRAEDFAEPMAEAIAAMDAVALNALLQRGADPNAPLPNGLLPLHAVVSARDRAGSWADPVYDGELNDIAVACARLLVEAGADPWGRMIARGSDGAWWFNMEQPALDTITPGNMRDKPLYAYLESLMAPRMAELRRAVHTDLLAFVQGAMDSDVEAMLAAATPVEPGQRNLSTYFPSIAEDYREMLERPADGGCFVLPIESDWVREQEAGILLRNRDGAEKLYTLFLLIHDGNGWRVINSIETDREDVVSYVWNLHGQYALIHYIRFAASRQVPPIMYGSHNPQVLRGSPRPAAVVRLDDTGEIVIDWMGANDVAAQTYLGLPEAEGLVHVQHGTYHTSQHLEADCRGIHLTHDTVTLPDGAALRIDEAGRLVLWQGGDRQTLAPGEVVHVSLDEGTYEVIPAVQAEAEPGTDEPVAE